MMRYIKAKILSVLMLVMMLVNITPSPVYAFQPDHLWVRAKLTYEFEKELTGISDDIVVFNTREWTKRGDWYYFNTAVEPGQTIRFIDGLKIPKDWGNSTADKKFNVVVHVEVSEVVAGDNGWDSNSEASYSQSFFMWNSNFQHADDVYIRQGNISVSTKEYQLDKNGKMVTYQNDKIVVPGQFVSKIVEFTINGDKGGYVEIVPEPPVKGVFVGDQNVDGKVVKPGTELTYTITVKNPAQTKQTITITDKVDKRLTITDTMGGQLIGDVNGGTITWTVNDIAPGASHTVSFKAKMPADGSVSQTIPNTAEAKILGKDLKTNTVIVSLGTPSVIQQIIARATGDSSNIPLYIGLMCVTMAALVAIVVHRNKRRKADI